MKIVKIAMLTALPLVFAVPALGKTYKTNYPVACSQVWSGVKVTLGNSDNYNVAESDDAAMTAKYDVKHSAHVNISGAALQRQNKVTLVTEGTGCQMQVVSNYSGWEHNDQGDFKKRVEEAMAKPTAASPAAAKEATPAPAAK